MALSCKGWDRKNLLPVGILATGILIILSTFFGWGVHCNPVTNILLLLLPIIVNGTFIVFLIVSIVYIALNLKADLKFSLLLLVTTCGITLIVVLLPLRFMGYKHRFESHINEYREVISLIEQGNIEPDEDGFALLPTQYRYLSQCGGEVMIDQEEEITRVLFFTHRDMFDDFAGYLYRSDNLTPQSNDFSKRPSRLKSWQSFTYLKPHWFIVNNF